MKGGCLWHNSVLDILATQVRDQALSNNALDPGWLHLRTAFPDDVLLQQAIAREGPSLSALVVMCSTRRGYGGAANLGSQKL